MSLSDLKSRIFGDRTSEITGLFYLAKELGCLGEIIGREFEVRDKSGKLIYEIKQRPMNIPQANLLMKELKEHNKREEKSFRSMRKK